MNYELFLKGKSIPELEQIAENWYARLTKLQYAYGFIGERNKKSITIIGKLMARLSVLAVVLTRPIKQPPYKEGGYIHEPHPHFLELDKEFIFPTKKKSFLF